MAFSRIQRYVTASIHEGLEKLEDPVVMVKQFMRELKERISETEDAIRKQEQLHQTLEKDLALAEDMIARREQQAKIAVDEGEEDLARKVLYSKRQAYEQKLRYHDLLEMSQKQILTKKQEQEELEKKYSALRDKKMELMLRVQAAKANEQMMRNQRSYSHQTQAIEDGFEQMEERVREMESRTSIDFQADHSAYETEIETELTQLKEKVKQD